MKENSPLIAEALKEASAQLQNPKEAAILLTYHLACDRLYLLTHEREPLKEHEAYFKLIERRAAGEPVEYITGSASFYSREFYIAPGALIPRPETELLIDAAKEIIAKEKMTHIAEIGTGSGIIAVMLALLFPALKITATDISDKALEIAHINARKFGVETQIRFIHTPFLNGINQTFDMIVSNPPYIARDFPLEKPLSYEPQNALFGGERGDEILQQIIDLAVERDVDFLLCEMGYDQRKPLHRYMQRKGIGRFEFYRDYSGFDRGFTAHIKE